MVVQASSKVGKCICNFSLVIKGLQFQHNLGPILHRLKNVAGFLLKTVMIQTDEQTESLNYILPLIIWVYFHSNFSGGLRKMISSRMSASWPFKVIKGH